MKRSQAFIATSALTTKKRPSIIITAPHSYYVPMYARIANRYASHPTDYAAEKAALDMTMIIHKELPNIIVRTLLSDRPRHEIDYNRPQSRTYPWRKEVQKLQQGASLLLDMHSFPSYTIGWTGYEIVLLDTYKRQPWIKELTKKLIMYNIKALYTQGSIVNDIIQQGQLQGIPSVLLEINESLQTQRRRYILKTVLHIVSSLLNL